MMKPVAQLLTKEPETLRDTGDHCQRSGIAACLLAPAFIAVSIILVKVTGATTNPLAIAGLGSLIAAAIYGLFVAFPSNRSGRGQDLQLRAILTQQRRPFLQVLITRSIIGQVLIIAGFASTTALKAILLLRLEPVFVFVWSVLLLNEKVRIGKLALLAGLLVGTGLVVAPADAIGSSPNLGDLLIVLSLLFLSYSYLPTQKVVAHSSAIGLNLLNNLIGGAVITALTLAIMPQAITSLTATSLSLIAAYAIIFPLIATALYFHAFKTVKPWVIASFLSLEVVYGLILAIIFLHEPITPTQSLGTAIVIAMTMLIAKGKSKAKSA